MLFVLWVALILNSILISKQVSYYNFKPRTSLLRRHPRTNNRKTHSTTPLVDKLRNIRKQKRKEKIVFRADVDDWGYEDISEPVQYNYKEVWWTKNYPDPTVKTRKPTKINVYHKDLTANATKATILDDHPTIISTTTDTEKKKPNNFTKLFSKKDLVNQTNIYNRASSQADKRTTQTKRTFTDKNKGFFIPIFSKDNNGQFSILANKTDVTVKRNENDSDIRGSITNTALVDEDLDLNSFDFIVFNNYTDPKKPLAKGQTLEPLVIDIFKTDNIAETLKKQSPDKKFILDPRLSPGLPHIVKDGIYRIEIPDPVTKKKYVNTPTETNFEKRASQNLQPPRPFAESALRDHNINAGNRQRPFRNIKIPRPGPGPFYNPKSFGQNSQQGPFYKPQNQSYDRQGPIYGTNNVGQNGQGPFYNPQNPGYDRQGPFYNPQSFGYNRQGPKFGPNNLGQNEQGPIYNPQNLGYDRQRPNYGIYNFGQYRQGPFYNPQTLGYDRQQPIYSTNNLAQNRQTPYYNPANRQGPIHGPKSPTLNKEGIHNAQSSPHDIQGPSYSTHRPERDRKDPQDTTVNDTEHTPLTDATKILVDLILSTQAPIVSPDIPHTVEPKEGPNKDNAPVHIPGPTIGPISPFVRHMMEDMALLNTGYFSMFFARLFELIAKMEDNSVRKLLTQAQWEAEILVEKEHFLDQFGEPFVSYFVGMANGMEQIPVDVAKSTAAMLHYAMVNRRVGLTQDINSVIDYIDSLYEKNEGIELFRVAEDIEEFPHSHFTRIQLYRRLSKALFQPVKRIAGTAQQQILFEALNRVIENHNKPPEGVLARRQGKKFEKNMRFHYTRLYGDTRKVRNEGSTRLYPKKKNVNSKKSTKRLSYETLRKPSPRKSAATKKMYARTKNLTLKNSRELIQEDNSVIKLKKIKKLASKMTQNNKDENSEIHDSKIINAKKMASEINKTTYFIQPLSETTVKNVRFTIKDMKSYRPADAIPKSMTSAQNNTQNDKIDKLKEIIADQIFEAKAQNFISKSEQTNIARNETSDDEEETKEGLDILEVDTETTTPEPLKASSVSKVKHKEKKKNHKHKKTVHFSKKEIKYLRHKHPKLYKLYLKYLKKNKHNRNHKKKTHKEHKKKSHHFKKKKRNKKHPKIQNIERHYDHLLRHFMLKRTHLNKRLNDSDKDVSKECKHILSVNNNSNELSYLYDSFRSIEMEMSKDINDNVNTVPNYAFITPVNNYMIPGNDTTTTKWVHYPINKKILRASNQNFQVPNDGINKNVASDNSKQFSGSVWDDKVKVNEIRQSSYSDEEYELKFNLNDAMRHDKFNFNPQRRSINVTEDKNKLHSFSSYSSEEVVLKSNIYKAFKFNKHHSRANFSDIVKKPIGKNIKKVARRTEVKPVNEMTSYSDEEDILKRKLKL